SAPAPAPPRTAAPAAPAAEPDAARAAPRTAPPPAKSPAPAARPRRAGPDGKKRAMALGLMAVGAFFLLAGGVIAVVVACGNPDGSGQSREPRNAASQGQQSFLEACTKNWGIEERRCRCFLAAAGPNLQPNDYDDFTDLVEAHVAGDATLMESVLQQVT